MIMMMLKTITQQPARSQRRRLLLWQAFLATVTPLWTARAVGATSSSTSNYSTCSRSSSTSTTTASGGGAARGNVPLVASPLRCFSSLSSSSSRLSLPFSTTRQQQRAFSVRGGGGGGQEGNEKEATTTLYETRAEPAPGSPFHYAFPVHDLALAKDFYGRVLGCQEGRSSTKWQDYSLHGHQIVSHWVGDDYRCVDYYNPVDGDEVPVPHTGLALTVEQFHVLAARVKAAGIPFIIEPHLRFEGMPGEQYTMFFKDPSGNNLEFKAMTKPENLFAKYNVADK